MFTSPGFAAAMRDEQARTGAPGRADLLSAGILATAPGGHGTEYGLPVPTLTWPEEAAAWVDARLAEGSDYIKIISEDGSAYGRTIPTLDRATIAAVVAAAHERGKLAVVHVSTEERAVEALESEANGLAHVFDDRPPGAAFVDAAVAAKAFVIPTLTVVESTTGEPSGRSLIDDPRLAPYLIQAEIDNRGTAFGEALRRRGGVAAGHGVVRRARPRRHGPAGGLPRRWAGPRPLPPASRRRAAGAQGAARPVAVIPEAAQGQVANAAVSRIGLNGLPCGLT